MNEKLIFASKNKIGVFHQSSTVYRESEYLQRYKKNREDIQQRSAWKTDGIGAAFRGEQQALQYVDAESIAAGATINGLSFIGQDDSIVYSVTVENFSGLFIKNLQNAHEPEGHIIHQTNVQFMNHDYHRQRKELVIAIEDAYGMGQHIAIMNLESPRYHFVTEGDSVDENPVWLKSDQRVIYYESSGIGRDQHGNYSGRGPKAIQRLDLESGSLEEVAAFPNYDCFLPKLDQANRLYFIKRPNQTDKRSPSATLKDILLMPVKIAKAIFNWINFFTMRYTGETLTRGNDNPAKSKMDPHQIFIMGNLIHAEKALKENQAKGEKYPGIVPRDWELVRMERSGELVTVKKGVLDYNITPEGNIIYSNGTYLVRLTTDGKEEVLDKASVAQKITCYA